MTEKEWKIIDEEFISYTGGTAQLISNGECKVHLWETPKDAQLFCDKLNEQHETIKQLKQENMELKLTCKPLFSKRQLHKENQQLKKENQHIKTTITEAYNNERTDLGRSVLKQLIENI